MSFTALSLQEKDVRRVIDRINQLGQGRSNATGLITLSSTGATSTSITSALTCATSSHVFLSPQSAAAAAMQWYIQSTNVSSGTFIVSHTSSTSSGMTYAWHVVS